MGEPIKNPKGINFKEHPENGTLDIGVHIDQFIEYLLECKKYESEAGWINFNGFRNKTTYSKKDYSHTLKLKHPDLPVEKMNPKRVEEWQGKRNRFNIGGCNTVSYADAVRGLEKSN